MPKPTQQTMIDLTGLMLYPDNDDDACEWIVRDNTEDIYVVACNLFVDLRAARFSTDQAWYTVQMMIRGYQAHLLETTGVRSPWGLN